jgi:pyridoxine 4-dehydrogenase
VQNRFSLEVREHEDVLRACREQGTAFVPFFAIAGERRADGGSGAESRQLLEVARRHGATPAQVRLAWTLHQSPNVLAIPGTGNPAHLAENVAAGALRLTEELFPMSSLTKTGMPPVSPGWPVVLASPDVPPLLASPELLRLPV